MRPGVTLNGWPVLSFSSAQRVARLDAGGGIVLEVSLTPAQCVALAGAPVNLDVDMKSYGPAVPLTTREVFRA